MNNTMKKITLFLLSTFFYLSCSEDFSPNHLSYKENKFTTFEKHGGDDKKLKNINRKSNARVA